jgi:hypothetical protein
MISTSSSSTFSSYTLWKLYVDELWLSRQKAKALAQKGNLLLSCRWLPKMRVYIMMMIIIIIITRENRKKRGQQQQQQTVYTSYDGAWT